VEAAGEHFLRVTRLSWQVLLSLAIPGAVSSGPVVAHM